MTSLTNGTQYYFKVAAVNAVGTGSQTSSVNATPATTPAAPTSVAGTNGDTQSVITWTAPTDTGGSAITGYKIKCGATSGYPGNATVYHQTNTTTSYTKTGLTNGTQYSIQVAAVNAEGDGTYSSTATATPAAASSGITPVSTDAKIRVYLPASTTKIRIWGYNSIGDIRVERFGTTSLSDTTVLQTETAYNMYTSHYSNKLATSYHGERWIDITGMPTTSAKRLEIFGVNGTSGYSAASAHQLQFLALTRDGGSYPSTSNAFVDAIDFSGCTEIRGAQVGGQFSSGTKFSWTQGGSLGNKNDIYRSGSSSSPGSDGLTEVRAINCRFSGGGVYSHYYGSTYQYFGGLNVF